MSLTLNSTKALAIILALMGLLVLAAARTASVSAESMESHGVTTARTASRPEGAAVHIFALGRLFPPSTRPAGSPSVQVIEAAEVHSGPGSYYLAMAATKPGEQYTILGKSIDGHWWRIDFGGQPAWLSVSATGLLAESTIP